MTRATSPAFRQCTGTGPATPESGSARSAILGAVVLAGFFTAGFLIAFLATGDREMLLIGAAMGPILILLGPQLFTARVDLLTPLNFIALTALFGTSLRSLYVVYAENEFSRRLLLAGEEPEFLLPAVLLINVASACLAAGYLLPLPSVPVGRAPLLRQLRWSRRKVAICAALLVIVSIVCLAVYVHRLGIRFDGFAALSAKRRVAVGGARYPYAVLGYYLWGMSLVSYAFYLLWTELAFSRRRLLSVAGIPVLAIGLLAGVPPFITSSRTGFLTVPVYALIIWHYARRPLRLRWITGAVLGGLLVISIMGGIRALGSDRAPVDLQVGAVMIPDTILGNRNWLGVTKTAHLMKAVPEEVDYQHGKTFLTWLVAPVPRTFWPEKPVIRVGVTVGEEVFQKEGRSGVPPGFIGELYLNFGYPGTLVGMFLLGAMLRLLYVSFRPLVRTHPSALLVYTVTVFPLAFTLVTTDLSGTILDLGRSLITLGVLLPMVAASGRRGRPAAASLGSGERPAT